jgi:hypothetical protein
VALAVANKEDLDSSGIKKTDRQGIESKTVSRRDCRQNGGGEGVAARRHGRHIQMVVLKLWTEILQVPLHPKMEEKTPNVKPASMKRAMRSFESNASKVSNYMFSKNIGIINKYRKSLRYKSALEVAEEHGVLKSLTGEVAFH